MKTIIIGDDTSSLETEVILSGGEVFFPHNWTHEEFWHISCLCDHPFHDDYNRDAEVKVELLVEGEVVHEHNYTFKGGTNFHSNAKDEVRNAIYNYPRKTQMRHMVRITTEVEERKD